MSLYPFPISSPEILPPCSGRRWVISDVHGCSHTLEVLLEKIDLQADDTLFFLGDYINKGPYSGRVLDNIIGLQKSGARVYALRGNHDQALLNANTAGNLVEFTRQNGSADLLDTHAHLQPAQVAWLEKLPFAYDLGDFLLVHAGFDFSLKDPFFDAASQMTIRDFSATVLQTQGRRIVHGHNPKPIAEILLALETDSLVVPLDNGCVYFGERPGMGHLLALELNQLTLIQVPNAEPGFAWRTYIPEIKSLPPMDITPDSTLPILAQLENIRQVAELHVMRFGPEIEATHPRYRASSRNLLHYLALRQQDIRDLQDSLGELGVTRLGRAEANTQASLVAVTNNLRRMNGIQVERLPEGELTFRQGSDLLRTHADDLLGPQSATRKVRIMVTLATEAAHDFQQVKQLLEAEVNCVRINCAHDEADLWLKMIENVRQASRDTGMPCKVAMDLAGPKLRTGPLVPGPQVLKLKPEKGPNGETISPFRVRMVALGENDVPVPGVLSADASFLAKIQTGDNLLLRDVRGKKRNLEVVESGPHGCTLSGEKTTYLQTGTPVRIFHRGKSRSQGKIGLLTPIESYLLLKTGDTLILHLSEQSGENARTDSGGKVLPAHLSCPVPEVYQQVKIGEKVLLDDGEIEGIIEAIEAESLMLRITFTRPGGSKLRADKGINLPYSDLRLDGLTAKDREDLGFMVKHADIVNVSFVNSSKDVLDLIVALDELGAPPDLGIILKIETLRGFTELPAILLAGMRRHRLGVMIARGDLAVEAGWNLLAEVQEEILRVCEAAHVPIVWATQVLESMAKTGRPSRAEITDAAMGQRAECVMLNKGPYILEAVHMLHDILSSMQNFHQKKAPMLPMLRTPALL